MPGIYKKNSTIKDPVLRPCFTFKHNKGQKLIVNVYVYQQRTRFNNITLPKISNARTGTSTQISMNGEDGTIIFSVFHPLNGTDRDKRGNARVRREVLDFLSQYMTLPEKKAPYVMKCLNAMSEVPELSF